MTDPRLDILHQRGMVGEDATTALATFDARGGMNAAYEALGRQFGHDAVRAALMLIAGPTSEDDE